jgi:hypothetical protein
MPQSLATEIAKDRFYDQMERYRNLNDGLDLPAAVIPLYFAALLFFADRLTAYWPKPWSLRGSVVAYVALLFFTMFFAVVTIWAACDYCRTIWSYQDAADLPSPKEMDDWLREMEKYASAISADAEDVCDAELRGMYVDAADSTFKYNERRSRRLFYCRRRLVLSLVLTGATMASYYSADQFYQSELRANAKRDTQARTSANAPATVSSAKHDPTQTTVPANDASATATSNH